MEGDEWEKAMALCPQLDIANPRDFGEAEGIKWPQSSKGPLEWRAQKPWLWLENETMKRVWRKFVPLAAGWMLPFRDSQNGCRWTAVTTGRDSWERVGWGGAWINHVTLGPTCKCFRLPSSSNLPAVLCVFRREQKKGRGWDSSKQGKKKEKGSCPKSEEFGRVLSISCCIFP